MATYIPTQNDIECLYQRNKKYFIKLELLNSEFQKIDEMQNEVISGSYTIDADSDIRRTCNFNFFVKDNSYLISETAKIWIDRYVRVMIGVLYNRTEEILWYNLGMFLFNENNYQYDSVTRSLSLGCVDLMANFNGEINGMLSGEGVKIETYKGLLIRQVMIDVVTQLGHWNNYLIDLIGKEYGDYVDPSTETSPTELPYDLEFPIKTTVYDIIRELRDLYPGWETFFDNDGTFICQKIPTLIEDDVVLDDSILDTLVIREPTATDIKVKNSIEVYGMQLEPERYTENVSGRPAVNLYIATFNNLTSIPNGTYFSIKIPFTNNATDSPTSIRIVYTNGTTDDMAVRSDLNDPESYIDEGKLKEEVTYVFKYIDGDMYYIGELSLRGKVKLVSEIPASPEEDVEYVVDPTSPFTIDKIGEYLEVFEGGEYENIYTEMLCYERARYELWRSTNLQQTLTLGCILIPWIDVNKKISYTSKMTGETQEYIIKTVNFNFIDGTMDIGLAKFYPQYNF